MSRITDVPIGLKCNTLTITGEYIKYRDWLQKSRVLWRSVCSECNQEMIVVPEQVKKGKSRCLCDPVSKKRTEPCLKQH